MMRLLVVQFLLVVLVMNLEISISNRNVERNGEQTRGMIDRVHQKRGKTKHLERNIQSQDFEVTRQQDNQNGFNSLKGDKIFSQEMKISFPVYDQNIGKYSASLSAISHCSADKVNKWTCKQCIKHQSISLVKYVVNTATNNVGFVGYDKTTNKVIVVFRGTEGTKNWIEDLTFDTVEEWCLGCQVHQGFLLAYRSIAQQVELAVKTIMSEHPTASLFFSGHSLGSAMGLIAALEFRKLYPSTMMTFYGLGTPRIGNINLARFAELKLTGGVFRIIHFKDIVPHVPPLQMGFHHSPFEIFYQQDMKSYKVCTDGQGQDKTCSNQYSPYFSPEDHPLYWIQMDSSVC